MPQWISDIITVWPVLGAFVLLGFGIGLANKLFGPIIKKITQFLDDWNGEPARDGVPERPGAMKRFQSIEEFTTKYGPIIDRLDHEMHPNSGSSMADAVNRTEKNLSDHLAACPAVVPQTTVTVNTGA